jgi:hypothetical protein
MIVILMIILTNNNNTILLIIINNNNNNIIYNIIKIDSCCSCILLLYHIYKCMCGPWMVAAGPGKHCHYIILYKQDFIVTSYVNNLIYKENNIIP